MSPLDEQKITDLIELMSFDGFVELVGSYQESSAGHFENLLKAIADNDLDLLKFAAHSLKGGSANIGAKSLSELFLQLEQAASNGELGDDIHHLIEQIKEMYQTVLVALREKITNGEG